MATPNRWASGCASGQILGWALASGASGSTGVLKVALGGCNGAFRISAMQREPPPASTCFRAVQWSPSAMRRVLHEGQTPRP
jgi:hypothetical protein